VAYCAGNPSERPDVKRKNGAAAELGRLGGKARAKILSPEERQDIARQGGLAKAAKRNGTAAALKTETELAEFIRQSKMKDRP
jgi:general stress protein YciG